MASESRNAENSLNSSKLPHNIDTGVTILGPELCKQTEIIVRNKHQQLLPMSVILLIMHEVVV